MVKLQLVANAIAKSIRIEATEAIGIVSKAGRYGGTYAHSDIAMPFATWISPEFQLYIMKDYRRLKTDENNRLSLNWNLNREISKLNYRIHTDAIKESLILPELTSVQIAYISVILKGDWLKETGFEIGRLIQVECENGKLIITPRERENGKQVIKMAVWVTGDTHGDWIHRLKMDSFPEQQEMSKDDFVIICGDFGIWDNSKREKYNLDWLENKPFTTLFVSGNHENYDILDNFPVEEWHGGKVNFIRQSVIHLMRGQIFNIEDKWFFTFGGASSHDISAGILEPDAPDFKQKKKRLDKNPFALYRINHVSWWERELPNDEEMEEGLWNLERQNNKVDYIITHSPYTSLLKQMDGGSGLYQSDRLTDYLQEIKQTVDYKHWLFGHLHQNKTFHWERSSCLYEQIIRIH